MFTLLRRRCPPQRVRRAGVGSDGSLHTVQWTWHGEQHTGQLDTTGAPGYGEVQKVRVDEHGELLSSRFGIGRAAALVVLVTIASAITALVLALVGFRSCS